MVFADPPNNTWQGSPTRLPLKLLYRLVDPLASRSGSYSRPMIPGRRGLGRMEISGRSPPDRRRRRAMCSSHHRRAMTRPVDRTFTGCFCMRCGTASKPLSPASRQRGTHLSGYRKGRQRVAEAITNGQGAPPPESDQEHWRGYLTDPARLCTSAHTTPLGSGPSSLITARTSGVSWRKAMSPPPTTAAIRRSPRRVPTSPPSPIPGVPAGTGPARRDPRGA